MSMFFCSSSQKIKSSVQERKRGNRVAARGVARITGGPPKILPCTCRPLLVMRHGPIVFNSVINGVDGEGGGAVWEGSAVYLSRA